MFCFSGPPIVKISNHSLSGVVNGIVNVTVNWTLIGGDSADFYLISINTNTFQTGLLNITTASVTQYELTGFMIDYAYNITVRGVNCGRQEGKDSETLTITPQCMYNITASCSSKKYAHSKQLLFCIQVSLTKKYLLGYCIGYIAR